MVGCSAQKNVSVQNLFLTHQAFLGLTKFGSIEANVYSGCFYHNLLCLSISLLGTRGSWPRTYFFYSHHLPKNLSISDVNLKLIALHTPLKSLQDSVAESGVEIPPYQMFIHPCLIRPIRHMPTGSTCFGEPIFFLVVVEPFTVGTPSCGSWINQPSPSDHYPDNLLHRTSLDFFTTFFLWIAHSLSTIHLLWIWDIHYNLKL